MIDPLSLMVGAAGTALIALALWQAARTRSGEPAGPELRARIAELEGELAARQARIEAENAELRRAIDAVADAVLAERVDGTSPP